MTLYSIKDWNTLYENNRTRELKKLDWFPMPNKQDGDGYTSIMEHKDGAAILGAFVACAQIASRCDPRGTLLRDGNRPHDAASLARMSRIPQAIMQRMLEVCSSKDVNWLEKKELPEEKQGELLDTAGGCDIPAGGCLEGKEGKGMKEGKGKVAAALPQEAEDWNRLCGTLPKVAAVTGGRAEALTARRKEPFWVENFAAAVIRISKSSFCTGTNNRQWKADFDFILQRDAIAKIMEGKYDNKAPLGTNGQPKVERNLDVWHIGDGKYNLTSGPKREHFPNDGSFQSHLRMYESWQANRLRQKGQA